VGDALIEWRNLILHRKAKRNKRLQNECGSVEGMIDFTMFG
jgi:hypothetical protein